MNRRAEKVVCVTGASGYTGSWIVKLLLERGYVVKGTVLDLSDPSEVAHMKELEGAKERLQLFEANLVVEGSFDAAVDGCDGVFHTASPVILSNFKDPQEELMRPSVDGTLNVLRSCIKAPSVQRVVFTSTVGAVFFGRTPRKNNVVVDESWVSDPTFCEEIKGWYYLSKTLAEECAWKFAKEHGIDLVVLNPGVCMGPCLQPTINVSTQELIDLIKGGKSYVFMGNEGCAIVDIRDVAAAHIAAFENPSAHGRYLLVAATMHHSETFSMLRRLYPTLGLPKRSKENESASATYRVSDEKAKSLGIRYTPVEQTFKDSVEFLKEKNLLSF